MNNFIDGKMENDVSGHCHVLTIIKGAGGGRKLITSADIRLQLDDKPLYGVTDMKILAEAPGAIRVRLEFVLADVTTREEGQKSTEAHIQDLKGALDEVQQKLAEKEAAALAAEDEKEEDDISEEQSEGDNLRQGEAD